MNREDAIKKAKALVAEMTLEERASQLKYDSPAIKRLGVPAYNWWNEALHGVARAGVATSFPQAIGMAATFDDELLKRVAEVIAEEGRAKYNAYSQEGDRDIYKGLTFWSPNVNIFRDPRWGRGHETYGEDPYLTSRLGVAFVKGLQGEEGLKTAACAKHFAVHSGPEADRHHFDARVSQKDLWETYLPAFEALVKEAEVESVMGAYNRTNGEPCCGSPTLMKDILREKWGFQGHYVSDCWAIKDFHEHHMVTSTAQESAALALKSGCDLNCGNTYLHILMAYQNGLVTEEEITTAAERLFTTRYLLGLFDGSTYDAIPYEVVESKPHLSVADEATAKSIVLLKNNGLLPLNKESIKTIGVIGPNANSRKALIGNYHGTSSQYITILEGLQKEVGDEVRILYSEGSHLYADRVEPLAYQRDRLSEAKIVAKHSDVVIVCVGLDETLEGEEGDTGNAYASGDKRDLALPEPQQELVEAMAKMGKPVILCLSAGSAIDLQYADAHYDAVLQAWYPGARGGQVIAKALLGEIVPSGKLPVTFYRDLSGLPAFEDYSMQGRTYRYMQEEALYPFGYGLTYGKCRIEEASYDQGSLRVLVHNEVDFKLEEVVQLYIKNLDSEFAVPNHSLCGFKRVSLEAGETKEIQINVSPNAFKVVNEQGEWIQGGKVFELYVGFGQPDERTYALTGMRPTKIMVEFLGE
ncbi:glycoside hydrolase family 3 C-terminal domain-containing protein [Cellulosilyticum lentocellum]|uniref:Beta-glucosidase n=1 Tax=Cellulosilyticum lentocellum (strain ATCC 49066 / DSM 5427 / NCIMB 11756 / RHM5) TaxID=642492 RepID=F2JID1_CELLD|nr:glycoside hydrolase family 3 C-terminal domain-containing protein [Cellulosilyticum lentocellum]ADZ84297.1 Beta-glucosidase [Cellulosilyticum lentocellum DSM 5427]